MTRRTTRVGALLLGMGLFILTLYGLTIGVERIVLEPMGEQRCTEAGYEFRALLEERRRHIGSECGRREDGRERVLYYRHPFLHDDETIDASLRVALYALTLAVSTAVPLLLLRLARRRW